MLKKMMRPKFYQSYLTLLLITALAPFVGMAQIGSGSSIAGGGFGGFGGPSILGNGNSSSLRRAGSDAALRFYAGVNGIYDSGLSGFGVDANGNFPTISAKGVELLAGVYGSKAIRRGILGISYQGSYRQYNINNGLNGVDQSLALQFTKQFTARSQYHFDANAGTTNRLFGLQGFGGNVSQIASIVVSPLNELFNNRIYFGSGTMSYSYLRSARSSFSIYGGGTFMRRTGSILFGLNGANAGAGYSYRLNRRQSLSISYNYFLFNYTRNFGDTNGHGTQITYQGSFGRKLNLTIQGGVTRLELLTLRNVAVDPVIAALIGIATTQEVFYGITYLPTGTGNIDFRLSRNHALNGSGGLVILPGNGVLGTSRNANIGGGYNYTGLRKVSLGFSSFYNRTSTLNGPVAKFDILQNSFNASARLRGDLFLTLATGSRQFLSGFTANFNKNALFMNVGLAWSPGAPPLSIR